MIKSPCTDTNKANICAIIELEEITDLYVTFQGIRINHCLKLPTST